MGYNWRVASGAGRLNNAEGLMELVIASIGLSSGTISPEFYSILVVIAMVSTLLATPVFRLSRWGPVMADQAPAVYNT
jgi:Kef-type K+ transport system membrane component KefB